MLKMRSLAETLASAGQLISDDELTLYILGGLGHDYDSVVVNLTSRHDQVTLQEVQYMLQSQEMRLEQLNLSSPSDTYTPNANLATHLRKSLNLHSFNNNFSNPSSRNFANERGRGRGKWGRGNRPLCQLCNRPGHIALKCYHRFDISFQGQHSSNPQHTNNPFSAKSVYFQSFPQSLFAKSSQFPKSTLWHMRLGHPSINDTTVDSFAADPMSSQVLPGAISPYSSSVSPVSLPTPSSPANHASISPSTDQPTSSSSTLPLPSHTIVPSHPMITRSKAGIFKPKTFVASTLRNLQSPTFTTTTPASHHAVVREIFNVSCNGEVA
ncbi:hypothetical protein DKX38_001152 [Salix brachista]|uniref:GAG-pre-integrase domain-containing protein n=1 Tax=Salix brachista TaxID=2182728 RepID=A0A5N5P422_9ROSI|nr:hypothetical protein DKX38_001152 [Salix brachista]